MLLCIDIGNTSIVYGVYEKDVLLNTFRLETKINQTMDEYGIKILDILAHFKIDATSLDAIVISSVVPQIDVIFDNMAKKYFNLKPMFIGPGIKTGIKIKIENPKQLGADILTGVVGAVEKYGSPCLIIDMGTATTFGVVNEKMEYLGGVILPGVLTSFSNLTAKAAKLENVKLEVPSNIIGRDTVTAIQSGMVFGTAAQIDGLIRKIKKEAGPMKVVLTGGLSSFVHPYLEEKAIIDNDLLLEGLRLIYQKNV